MEVGLGGIEHNTGTGVPHLGVSTVIGERTGQLTEGPAAFRGNFSQSSSGEEEEGILIITAEGVGDKGLLIIK